MTLRILITNDDGIGSPGIRRLAAAFAGPGHDVVVAAPAEESSGSSASLAAVEDEGRIVVARRALDGLPDVPGYAVAASPGFIALLATRGAFGPVPDVVLSGINRGANAGLAVLHSGTVGAAFTAAAAGCRAMAVSLDVLTASGAAARAGDPAPAAEGDGPPGTGGIGSPGAGGIGPPGAGGGGSAFSAGSGGAALRAVELVDDEQRNWDTPARVAVGLLSALLSAAPGTVLNVNAPDVPYHRLPGLRRASLARFGQVQMTVVESGEDFVRTAVEESGAAFDPGSDLAVLADGYACVTAVRAVTEVPDVDLPGLS